MHKTGIPHGLLILQAAGASLRHPGDIDYEMARDMTIEYLATTNHYYLYIYLDFFFVVVCLIGGVAPRHLHVSTGIMV